MLELGGEILKYGADTPRKDGPTQKPVGQGPLVAIPASDFRVGRTGGQLVWRKLIDHLKSSNLPVVCEDELPVPARVQMNPYLAALWYYRAYGGLRVGVLLTDQSAHGRQGLLIRRLARRASVRTVVVVHHLRERFRYTNPLYVRFARASENKILRLADCVIVHTDSTREEVVSRGVPVERINVIPLGHQRTESAVVVRNVSPDNPLRLLWIGGDFVRKGLDTLLQAMARRPNPPRLTVVGRPETATEFHAAREQARNAGLAAQVEFLGQVDTETLEACWTSHDVFALPSRKEGYGLAVDEALAHGMPLLLSDLAVFRERIGSEEALFVPVNDVEAITRAVATLESRKVRESLSRRALKRGSSLPTWEATASAYEKLIRAQCTMSG